MSNSSIIVNGDDFGWDRTCSLAILESFQKGYITTTTACANGHFFYDAVSLIQQTPYKDRVGIHINLTEGEPITEKMKVNSLFCNENGEFALFDKQLKFLSNSNKKDIYDEMTAQVKKYKSTGLSIHHADSHHHIHNFPNIFNIYLNVMKEQGITRIRRFRNIGKINYIKKRVKDIYNAKLDLLHVTYSDCFGEISDLWTIKELQHNKKTIEIMIHPDYDNNNGLIDRDTFAEYANPYGVPIINIYRMLENKNVSILPDF